MEDKIQQYQGKPTAYLDQNILDLFVSIGLGDFADGLKSKFQVVYSDETLKEIKRSGDYAEKFLNVLKKLDAYHLKIVLEQPGFVITDKATLTSRDPFQAYEEYLKNEPEYNNVQLAMEQSLYKFSGGRVGDGISEIHDEQKEAFTVLINQLRVHSKITSHFPAYATPCINGAVDSEIAKPSRYASIHSTLVANDSCCAFSSEFRASSFGICVGMIV